MKKIYFLSFLFLAFSSCSPQYTYFSQSLYDQYRWNDEELKQIQFYLSEDLVLHRDAAQSDSEIKEGSIRIIDGQKVEEVIIPRATPGVFLFSPKANRFAISFESGSDLRYLMFGPNPKAGDRYMLLAKDWAEYDGKVTYDGREYHVDNQQALTGLMVNLRKIQQVSVKSRVAGGRKL